MPDQKPLPTGSIPKSVEQPSLYKSRGKAYVGARDPDTCMTATIETIDDDRASSLLGVLAPS